MIADGYPWKQDLKIQKDLLLKYNNPEEFDVDDEEFYVNVEKSIFYSAFIIRKLIDSYERLSDDACRYSIRVREIKPLKPINRKCFWSEADSHDWGNERSTVRDAKYICNSLIHSHIFFFRKDENDGDMYFFVSSDYDINKVLYKISFSDWLKYINYVIEDNVVSMSISFDKEKEEYVCKSKKRGILKNL